MEFENETQTIIGKDAEKWLEADIINANIARAHGMNAFDRVEIERTIEKKEK